MPYMAESRITARQLLSGDVLVRDERQITVLEVEVKTKWVYVTHELQVGQTMERLPVDASVVVLRPQQTLLEKQALELTYSIHSIRDMMEGSTGSVEKRRSELMAAIVMRPSSHYHDYESYVEAQTIKEIWDNVVAVAEYESMNLRDATLKVKAEITNDLVNARHSSRSTSLMSNTVDSIVLQAKANWVQTLGYRVR